MTRFRALDHLVPRVVDLEQPRRFYDGVMTGPIELREDSIGLMR